MANLTTYSFTQIVQRWVAAAQASCAKLINFSEGSVLLAIAEAAAGVVLWLQALILTVLGLTRAATSKGADLDSWMADFNFVRLPAVAAVGTETFSRVNTSTQAIIPIGSQVGTIDGSQTYAVQLVSTNPAYSPSAGGYVLQIGTASIDLPVMDEIGGSAGNVQAGIVTVLVDAIAGVDSVANAAAFTGGVDAESDVAFRARFILYLDSLDSADTAAIEYAVASVQAGIQYKVVQNKSYPALASRDGYFFVIVNDGTGTPPDALLQQVSAAVDAVRGCGIQYGVFGPTVVTATIGMTIKVVSGYNPATVQGTVQTALANYLKTLPLGTTLVPITRLAQVAYDSTPGCALVVDDSITVNAANADLVLTLIQVVEPGVVTITVAT